MKHQFKHLSFVINILGIFSSVYVNQYFGIMLIILSMIANKELIIANLVVAPFYETIIIIADGISITKVLYLFAMALTFFNLIIIKPKKIILLDFVFAFSVLILFSTLNVRNAYYVGTINEFNLLDLILYYLSRLLLFFLLVNYLINKSEKFFQNSTKYISLVLIFVVPMVVIYFETNSFEINWYNKATRKILFGADPNELSVIIISFFPFVILSKKLKHVFKILIILSSIFLIFQLASRTSLLLFISFLILFPFYYYSKNSKRLFFLFIIYVIFNYSLEFLIQQNFDIINRIIFSDDLDSFTGNRFSLYIGSINAFLDNPIFGYGANNLLASEINFEYSGIRLVSHNIILEFLMSFGLLGAVLVLILYFKNKRYFKIPNTYLMNTYFFSLFILLIGSFTLSWFWREILWVIFAIYFALNYKKYKEAQK